MQHLQVVYAAPGEGLRLRGALGPLQTEGVDGTLSWTLKPAEGGTSVTQSYVVGGYIRSGMEQWAPRIDRVLDEQLQRLKSFVRVNPRRNRNALGVSETTFPVRTAMSFAARLGKNFRCDMSLLRESEGQRRHSDGSA